MGTHNDDNDGRLRVALPAAWVVRKVLNFQHMLNEFSKSSINPRLLIIFVPIYIAGQSARRSLYADKADCKILGATLIG